MFEMLQPLMSASSTILNPSFEFPPDRLAQVISVGHQPTETQSKIKIVEPCKLTFLKHGIVLLFHDASITFCFNSEEDRNLRFDALLYFIIFKSFLNYNLFRMTVISQTVLDQTPEVEQVVFNLGRFTKKEFEGPTGKGFYHNNEPFQLVVEKQEIEDFLRVVNFDLFLALSYYLRGCENPDYFIIEYYKSIEVVRNYFGGETEMTKRLRPYGFISKDYKRLKKYANDDLEPLNIGRHALKKGAKPIFVDVKRLLVEPKSREIFEESSRICRTLIEMLIRNLKSATDQT